MGTYLFKESYQFDFPVMIQSFLIHFIERKLRQHSRIASEESPENLSFQLVLKSYYHSDNQVFFLRSGQSISQLISKVTDLISEGGIAHPVSGFELVAIPTDCHSSFETIQKLTSIAAS